MVEENGMFRVVLPGGELSVLYNKTRATEFVRLMEQGSDWEKIRIGYTVRD